MATTKKVYELNGQGQNLGKTTSQTTGKIAAAAASPAKTYTQSGTSSKPTATQNVTTGKLQMSGAASGSSGSSNASGSASWNSSGSNYQAQNTQQAAAPNSTSTFPSSGYTGLAGVSENTAAMAGKYQQEYVPSDTVNQAMQQMQAMQNAKPQGYTSKYGAQLEQILQKITNPEQFKYTFNGDELFKSYADEYTQRGKQASMDTMGQAAALTGGYGNSYASQAANQQYQQYLNSLYDRGMDLYDRAYQRWLDEQNNTMDQYSVLAQQDNTDYGRYRDTYGDWEKDRDYYTGRYDTENERDYTRYQNNLQYWTGLAQVENADYRSEQDRQEAIRQYNQNFAESQRQAEIQRNYNYAMQMLQNGKMPSDELLKLLGLSKADAKKLLNKKAGSGSGKGGSNKDKDAASDDGIGNQNIFERAWDYIQGTNKK